MTEETSCVYGRVVDAVHAQLGLLADSLAVSCLQDSPTLAACCADMVADAATEAVKKFRESRAIAFDT